MSPFCFGECAGWKFLWDEALRNHVNMSGGLSIDVINVLMHYQLLRYPEMAAGNLGVYNQACGNPRKVITMGS